VKTAINEGYGEAVVCLIYSLLENCAQAIRESKDDQTTVILDVNHLQYSKVTHLPCKFLKNDNPVGFFAFLVFPPKSLFG